MGSYCLKEFQFYKMKRVLEMDGGKLHNNIHVADTTEMDT